MRLRSRTERQLDPGHQLDRQCNTPNRPVATHRTRRCRPPGWYRYGNLLAWLGRGGVRRDRLPPRSVAGSLTGSLSIAHARSTVVERSGGMSTGPAHVPQIRSLAQSASRFTTPFFFSAPSRAANLLCYSAHLTSRCSDCSRSCCSWDSSLACAARSSWALASCANVCLCQVLRDRSTAAAWFRHLLHSARSSRYFSRSLLRLFNKGDRTRIRCGDFASSGALQDTLRSNRIGFHAR